jgi:hypothetical protein
LIKFWKEYAGKLNIFLNILKIKKNDCKRKEFEEGRDKKQKLIIR